MPAKFFRCNAGDKVPFEQCLEHCRERCLSLPALTAAVESTRHWFGKASVTQLIKPTRQAYLEIVHDYAIDPMAGIAAMIGTNSHRAFEESCPNGWLAEVRLEDDITSGQFDAYDCKNRILWDWKFFGAFRIAKALGYRPRWQSRTITRGRDKGKEKWEQVFVPGGVRDIREIAIQLNYYRYLMEQHGLQVKGIMVNMFVRGGVDATAKKYGITRAGYIVPVHFISLRWGRAYMKAKHDRLMRALDSGEMPPVCSRHDRWCNSKSYPDRKCRDWCAVNEFCPYWQEKYGGKA